MQHAQRTPQESPTYAVPVRRRRRSFGLRQWLLLAGIVVLVAAAGWVSYWAAHRGEQAIVSDRYQAVFLDDGKVFFGKLQHISATSMTLTHVYYAMSQTQSSDSAHTLSAGDIQVIKATDEVYGPDDSIDIQRGKVLFWQNLRADSKVEQLIAKQGN